MSLPQYIYHMAEAANWPLIQRDGLHSAASLIKRAKLGVTDRELHGRQQRPANFLLPSGAIIRHQTPMPPAALSRCLVGMSPNEWYVLLNDRVFFWLDPDRLNRQRSACAADPQVVMTIDAQRLVDAYSSKIYLTPINTGNARRRAAKRSVATFVPYARWLAEGWTSEYTATGGSARPRSHEPVELTIVGGVPDILQFVVATRALGPGESFVPGMGRPSRRPHDARHAVRPA